MTNIDPIQTISIDLLFNRAWHSVEARLDRDEEGDFSTVDVYVDDIPVFEPVEIQGHLDPADLHEIGQELATGCRGRVDITWVRLGRPA